MSYRSRYWSLLALLLLALFIVSGCLDFGDDVELKGNQIDASVLAKVERITEIDLPAGTKGLNYFFLGSGIDNALWLKVMIPQEKKAELLQNQLFTHKVDEPNFNMTLDRDWWSLNSLDNPVSYATEINNGTDFLGCTMGTQSGTIIMYIHWFST